MKENLAHAAIKLALLTTTALALGASGVAQAQEADTGGGVAEIIVTAQKREQVLQDVPIAVTALGSEELQANRVVSVTDLTGLAPGLRVSESAGGAKIPFFIMRGANSAGLVQGTDKQISLYLDGVYLASTRGSIFDLPDVARIEVLRGPQGTLFGRNATAGAVSISTRDPKGEPGIKAQGTVGNYDQYKMQVSVDLPQVGPFSAYFSFVRNYKRGDTRNVAAGQVWNRNGSFVKHLALTEPSSRYLGTTDSLGVFAAVKFESGDFTTTYKFDWNEDRGSTRGTALINYNPTAPLLGPLIDTLIKTQAYTVPIAADGRRPRTVSNGFVTPTHQKILGHSVTSTFQFSDDFSVKNIFAYREGYAGSPSSIDGLASLTITPQAIQPLATFIAFSTLPPAQAGAAIPGIAQGLIAAGAIGSPFVPVGSASFSSNSQTSDEIQFNYESDFLTATAGAVWFVGKDHVGEPRFQNTTSFSPVIGGIVTNTNIGYYNIKSTSRAAYAQLEFHVTPEIDIVGGARITKDKRRGTFEFGPTLATRRITPFTYRNTKPSFLINVNWKPSPDHLIYAKYSTGFVSGGNIAGIPFAPETVKSVEAGVKSEFFDRKLRANLALFWASYKHVQQPSSTTSVNARDIVRQVCGCTDLERFIGTFVADLGDVKSKGFELEVTAAPVSGLTLGGSLSYTDTDYVRVAPLQIPATGIVPVLTNRPSWSGSAYAQYDTPPIGGGDAYLTVRGDLFYNDSYILTPDAREPNFLPGGFGRIVRETPSYWIVNGRVALKDLDVAGIKTEIGVWAKNLTDKRALSFGLNLSNIIVSGNFIPARTFGADLIIEF
jgi:iron complex outermembrane receptor protein